MYCGKAGQSPATLFRACPSPVPHFRWSNEHGCEGRIDAGTRWHGSLPSCLPSRRSRYRYTLLPLAQSIRFLGDVDKKNLYQAEDAPTTPKGLDPLISWVSRPFYLPFEPYHSWPMFNSLLTGKLFMISRQTRHSAPICEPLTTKE